MTQRAWSRTLKGGFETTSVQESRLKGLTSGLLLAAALFISGCASTMHQGSTAKARIYNLKSGEVITLDLEASQRNRSTVVGSTTSASGETFTGEFTTTGRRRSGAGVSAGYYSGGGWSLGVGLDLMRWLGTSKQGTGVVRGDDGTVIDITYRISSGSAEGEGKDNRGVLYRFQCCDSDAPE